MAKQIEIRSHSDLMSILDNASLDKFKSAKNIIDLMTDDLLEMADIMEEHNINIDLGDLHYLNPVSKIRGKVDYIWDAVLTMERLYKEAIKPIDLTCNGYEKCEDCEYWKDEACWYEFYKNGNREEELKENSDGDA